MSKLLWTEQEYGGQQNYNLKEIEPWDDPEGGSARHQKMSRKEGRAGKKSERKDCRKIKEIGDFSSTDLYKKEMMLEE